MSIENGLREVEKRRHRALSHRKFTLPAPGTAPSRHCPMKKPPVKAPSCPVELSLLRAAFALDTVTLISG